MKSSRRILHSVVKITAVVGYLKEYFPYFLLIIGINIFAWYPVLSHWFFRAWEQSFFIGVCGNDVNLVCLMRGHALLYFINYKLFGWNPVGWYATAIFLHTVVGLLTFGVTKRLTSSVGIAFIVAVLFTINVVHNDVVTWGSFEGLYAFIMAIFLLSILSYLQFQKNKTTTRYIWYGICIFLFLLGLVVRESAVALPIILLFTELYTKKFVISRKYILSLFKIFLPFLLVAFAYLLFRNWYGGMAHDFVDGMVKLRLALIGQGRYVEYVWRGILSFGRYAAAHAVSYPILNFIRDIFIDVFPNLPIRYYFYPLIGTLYTILQISLIILLRNNKKIKDLLIFSFLWFSLFTTFFSFAFTITDDLLEIPIDWNTSRWRYFAFYGTVVFWVAVFWHFFTSFTKRYKTKKIYIQVGFGSLVIGTVLLQLFLLRRIEYEMYTYTFKPAKDFYTSFLREFKTLPKDYVFYAFQYSSPLGDFLTEWYFIRHVYYPNLTDERGREWGEGHFGMLLERLQKGTAKLDETFFLDYNPTDGLINLTKEARKIIGNQKVYTYPIYRSVFSDDFEKLDRDGRHQVTIDLTPKLYVEVPYTINIVLSGLPKEQYQMGRGNFTQNDQEMLTNFSKDRIDFLNNTKVSVCKTAPMGTAGEPAMYLLQRNLIDGNISNKSFWGADCKPAVIELDLGKEKKVAAIAFAGGENAPHLPADYTVSVSTDQKKWMKILSVDGNTLSERVDVFPATVTARYIHFSIDETTKGAMAMLSELEVFGEDAIPAIRKYKHNLTRLIHDSYKFGSLFLRLSWETDPNNISPSETLATNAMYLPFTADGQVRTYSFEPNESELFSTSGQLFGRHIIKLHLDFSGIPSVIDVQSLEIQPRFFLGNE